MTEYQHGGDSYQFSKEFGCNQDEVIDLSSNINFVKPKLDIDFNNIDISSYPNYNRLQDSIAKLYGVENSEIELFNGATSAIYALFGVVDLKYITLYAPIYLEYKKAAKVYGYEIDIINRYKDVYKNVQYDSLVIFVNPSTPDGIFYNLEKLMKIWIDKRCTVLIDESFLDFTTFNSCVEYLKRYSKLYILKSMTKFYSAAGIRIGVIISSSKNIGQLHSREPLWKISQFDSYYLQSAFRDKTFIERSNRLNSRNKIYLINMLKNYPFIVDIYPSSSNFVMLKLKDIDVETFQMQLAPYRIMVRNCANFDFLDNRYVRIAVKDIELLYILKEALCKISI